MSTKVPFVQHSDEYWLTGDCHETTSVQQILSFFFHHVISEHKDFVGTNLRHANFENTIFQPTDVRKLQLQTAKSLNTLIFTRTNKQIWDQRGAYTLLQNRKSRDFARICPST